MSEEEAILNVAELCKSHPPPKVRARLANVGTRKALTVPQLRQWTDEIYPQYAEECGIAEAVAPLVRSGRASPDVIKKASKKMNSQWTRELIQRLNSGELTVNYGGNGGKRKQKKRSNRRKTRKQRKH